MKKNDKNFEKNLIKRLTTICEDYKLISHGFSWLTHTVNFKDIAQSLMITCVYDTEQQLINANDNGNNQTLANAIMREISELGINIKPRKNLVRFDSEEACDLSHNGNWQARLKVKLH